MLPIGILSGQAWLSVLEGASIPSVPPDPCKEAERASDAGPGHRSTEPGQTADCSQDCSLNCSSAAFGPVAGSGGGGHRHHVTRFNDLVRNIQQTSRVIIQYQQTTD